MPERLDVNSSRRLLFLSMLGFLCLHNSLKKMAKRVKPEAVTVGNIKEALRQEFSGVDRALKLVAFRGRYRLWVLKTHTERPNKHNNLHFV